MEKYFKFYNYFALIHSKTE